VGKIDGMKTYAVVYRSKFDRCEDKYISSFDTSDLTLIVTTGLEGAVKFDLPGGKSISEIFRELDDSHSHAQVVEISRTWKEVGS